MCGWRHLANTIKNTAVSPACENRFDTACQGKTVFCQCKFQRNVTTVKNYIPRTHHVVTMMDIANDASTNPSWQHESVLHDLCPSYKPPAHINTTTSIIMAAIWNSAGHYIFVVWFLLSFCLLLLLFFPRLFSAIADWIMSTILTTDGVALVRI